MKSSINMSTNSAQFYSVIPAAGQGSRMQTKQLKQYTKIADATIIEHAIAPLLANAQIKKIIVVVSEDDQEWFQLSPSQHPKILTVFGAQERSLSVYNGLQALNTYAQPHDWVLVHDAVRPCMRHRDLDLLMTELYDHPVGGVLGTPVRDTLKVVHSRTMNIKKTIRRANVWQAQTPQMFRFGILHAAMENYKNCSEAERKIITDESSMVEFIGLTPKMVLGSSANIKLTYAEDLFSIQQQFAEA